jgi:ParB family transcriptional regulator, chromosome partitioning protein
MAKSQIEATVQARMAQFGSKLKRPAAAENAPGQDKYAQLLAHVGKIVSLPVAEIRFEENVRSVVNTETREFDNLVKSIRKNGVAQNLIVEVREVGGRHQIYCVAGQRRGLAAKLAGVTHAPCLIRRYEDGASRVAEGLAENLLREELHFTDVAAGYRELIRHGWTKDQIAEEFEKNEKTVRRYLAVAEWPADVLARIRQLPEIFTVRAVFNNLVNRHFPSHDALRDAVEEIISPQAAVVKRAGRLDAIKVRMEERLRMKISLKGTEEQGELKIRYKSKEELERLRAMLEGAA